MLFDPNWEGTEGLALSDLTEGKLICNDCKKEITDQQIRDPCKTAPFHSSWHHFECEECFGDK